MPAAVPLMPRCASCRQLSTRWGWSCWKSRSWRFCSDGQVQLLDRKELRNAVAAGTLAPETPYFDNTIGQQGQLQASWPAPARATWLARYFS